VLERCSNPPVQPAQLCPVEVGSGTQRVEPGPPERLVRVDVPDPGDGALVQQRRLERRAAAGEALAEPGGGEQRVERLVPDARPEIRLRLPGLEQEPRSETADVAIRNIRSVV
jgi:hypothetical protein